MMKTGFVSSVLIFALGWTSSVLATDFTVDPAHSNVDFVIRHLVSKVRGSFEQYRGSFSYDEKQKTVSNVQFSIDVASINTGNTKRDNHLRSAEFFDVEKYPRLEFSSPGVSMVSRKMKLKGDLTIRDQTHPVTLDVEYLGMAPNAEGIPTTGFIATGKIQRSQYGITWNKTLDTGKVLLGDDVSITINLEANASPQAKAASMATPSPSVKASSRKK